MPAILSLLAKPGLAAAGLVSLTAQTAAWAHSTLGRRVPTEHYYDLSGSMTHLAIVGHTVVASAAAHGGVVPGPRRPALGPVRHLGGPTRLVLYSRCQRVGKDARFDDLKKSPVSWAAPWIFQALWCFCLQVPLVVTAAALAGPAGAAAGALRATDILGAAVFAGGLAIEWTADRQKDAFKTANPSKPMTEGLFKYSVYPNYFGECSLWWGAYLLATPALSAPWMHAVALLAPCVDAALILGLSGVPMLEKSAWEKYGVDAEYRLYRARTSRLVPWWPKQLSEQEVTKIRAEAAAEAAKRAASGKGK
ncbi:hypothetical protein AMAG_07716 [Allomyces macrogynus ATCC 38327]|uniref:Uncharacterized protein n=1 Tax=Allomyces macrogynus (strain ATCC 38327) TaxID=578462 RepID=A0A0L0SJG5_ALLM3|nr:hypothetical protein AMAG_07716 [Allomyces macrogynus ATCC 38327]|eukprot:KNE62505.1 hypothetical protein AMAG_07716 [Allomyces macrogynus ATCC 38327]